MQFVKCIIANTDTYVYINIKHIVSIRPYCAGSRVVLTNTNHNGVNEKYIDVVETPEAILNAIAKGAYIAEPKK